MTDSLAVVSVATDTADDTRVPGPLAVDFSRQILREHAGKWDYLDDRGTPVLDFRAGSDAWRELEHFARSNRIGHAKDTAAARREDDAAWQRIIRPLNAWVADRTPAAAAAA